MEDSSRYRVATQPPSSPESSSEPPSHGVSASARPANPAFVGNAMKALFETAEVSIRRGDETRVITKNEPIEELAPRKPAPAESLPDELPPGLRPGPQAGLLLWIALAAGLVAALGWMLTRGL